MYRFINHIKKPRYLQQEKYEIKLIQICQQRNIWG
jgi:hypothetical protein